MGRVALYRRAMTEPSGSDRAYPPSADLPHPSIDLSEVSRRLDDIATVLSAWIRRNAQGDQVSLETIGWSELDAPATARSIRTLIRHRRDRMRFFPPELFADPAWDILLDLAAARLEGSSVPISSLCIAANVPTTTALRWIATMVDIGLLARRADPLDRRRIYVDLTAAGWDRMTDYFASQTAIARS